MAIVTAAGNLNSPGGASGRSDLTSGRFRLESHPGMDAALVSQCAAVLHLLAIRRSRRDEVLPLQLRTLRRHIRRARELVEVGDDAAAKRRYLGERVHLAPLVHRDECRTDARLHRVWREVPGSDKGKPGQEVDEP